MTLLSLYPDHGNPETLTILQKTVGNKYFCKMLLFR